MDKKEVLKKFMDTHDVLIVDKNASSRNRLLKTMADLGAKRHAIHSCASIEESEDIIKTKKIGIVLSDYFIGGGSGFDLFKMLREKFPNTKELCLILVTSNISQTAVAKAAEEDVDSFIIKPYTIQSIQENLISTVASKVKPSEYILKIEEGKSLMASGKYDESLQVLNAATKLHPRPALALFYIGQAEYLKTNFDEATGSYNKGLNFNNIHYKCLIGLYEIFMREERFLDAYSVVKKIAKYFPANPDRLTQIVRLAVRTENYADMQMYYEIFTSLEVRTELLINYIGAGMYIAGKHCLINKKTDEAMQFFDNIAVSCSAFTKFLRAVITTLVEHGKTDDAEKFLSRFDPDTRDDEDYLISDFLVSAKKFKDTNLTIKAGLQLYNKNIKDFICMQTMVDAMVAGGYKEDRILPYREEMAKLFSDKQLA
jgi:CheY-like chemotaxis protein